MKLLLAAIAARPRTDAFDSLAESYAGRTRGYVDLEHAAFRSEESFFETLERQHTRTPPVLVLCDSRGKQWSSEQFAAWLGQQRDTGQQTVVLAIGPADGWSDDARRRAHLLLSLGPMTFAHELARVVLSEQVYRAFTILSGHPYHTGH